MRKILALLFSLYACAAHAQIVGALPFTLQNGTIADANQVMSDLNTIVAGVNANAANAGINTNINALNSLTTPLVYTSGGTSNYIGGTSGGTANALVIASPIPSGFSGISGKSVTFIAGFTNTGPTTLNVASTGVSPVVKQTASGVAAMVGGEIVAGQIYTAVSDGAQYQIQGPSPQGSVAPCTIIDWTGAAAPSGYLLAGGAAVSRTTFAALFNCISVTGVSATTTSGSGSVVVPNSALFQVGWFVGGNNVTCNAAITNIPDGTHITISINAGANGATTLTIGPYAQGDCSTTFTLPSLSGRATVMRDVSGSVLTSATCANPASQGSNCGTQTKTLLQSDLPNVNVAGVVTDSGHTHLAGVVTVINNGGGAGINVLGSNSNVATTSSSTTGVSVASRINGNVAQTLVSSIAPTALVDKYIKF